MPGIPGTLPLFSTIMVSVSRISLRAFSQLATLMTAASMIIVPDSTSTAIRMNFLLIF